MGNNRQNIRSPTQINRELQRGQLKRRSLPRFKLEVAKVPSPASAGGVSPPQPSRAGRSANPQPRTATLRGRAHIPTTA